VIRLIPMNQEDYTSWRENAVREYAEDHIRDGRWSPDNALQESDKEFSQLLPNDLETKDNYLFSLQEETADQKVGYLWFAVIGPERKQYAFVYDFLIFEAFRRRGYGTQSFKALETKIRELGLDSIGLHVFGHNYAARELYKRLGYSETNVSMRKDLKDIVD